jgi:hypothetical protein
VIIRTISENERKPFFIEILSVRMGSPYFFTEKIENQNNKTRQKTMNKTNHKTNRVWKPERIDLPICLLTSNFNIADALKVN